MFCVAKEFSTQQKVFVFDTVLVIVRYDTDR